MNINNILEKKIMKLLKFKTVDEFKEKIKPFFDTFHNKKDFTDAVMNNFKLSRIYKPLISQLYDLNQAKQKLSNKKKKHENEKKIKEINRKSSKIATKSTNEFHLDKILNTIKENVKDYINGNILYNDMYNACEQSVNYFEEKKVSNTKKWLEDTMNNLKEVENLKNPTQKVRDTIRIFKTPKSNDPKSSLNLPKIKNLTKEIQEEAREVITETNSKNAKEGSNYDKKIDKWVRAIDGFSKELTRDVLIGIERKGSQDIFSYKGYYEQCNKSLEDTFNKNFEHIVEDKKSGVAFKWFNKTLGKLKNMDKKNSEVWKKIKDIDTQYGDNDTLTRQNGICSQHLREQVQNFNEIFDPKNISKFSALKKHIGSHPLASETVRSAFKHLNESVNYKKLINQGYVPSTIYT